jgi:hypothetical protein
LQIQPLTCACRCVAAPASIAPLVSLSRTHARHCTPFAANSVGEGELPAPPQPARAKPPQRWPRAASENGQHIHSKGAGRTGHTRTRVRGCITWLGSGLTSLHWPLVSRRCAPPLVAAAVCLRRARAGHGDHQERRGGRQQRRARSGAVAVQTGPRILHDRSDPRAETALGRRRLLLRSGAASLSDLAHPLPSARSVGGCDRPEIREEREVSTPCDSRHVRRSLASSRLT